MTLFSGLFLGIHALSLAIGLAIVLEYKRVLRHRGAIFDMLRSKDPTRRSFVRKVTLSAYVITTCVLIAASIILFFRLSAS